MEKAASTKAIGAAIMSGNNIGSGSVTTNQGVRKHRDSTVVKEEFHCMLVPLEVLLK